MSQLYDLLVNSQSFHDASPGRGQVSGLQHALQAASHAYLSGASYPLVAIALLHDAARELDEQQHGMAIAQLLDGKLESDLLAVLQHHSEFQSHSFVWLTGRYGSEPWYGAAVQLAAWDALSFDPNYKTLPLSFFRCSPVLEDLLAA